MSEPIIVKIGLCVIRYWPTAPYLETVWCYADPVSGVLGERKVPAGPNYDAANRAKAADLGYGTDPDATWRMSLEHETLHSWLAVQAGGDWSLTLWHVAHQEPSPPGLMFNEEEDVLAFQRALNGQPPSERVLLLAARCGKPLAYLLSAARAWLAQFTP